MAAAQLAGSPTSPAGASDLPTPALTVDLDAFDANVREAERLALGAGKLLRPHVKTHRTPALALRQLGPAAPGVTCATVGEAEAMVAAGIGDVLIANELVSADKIERAVALAQDARVALAVDAAEPAAAIAAEAARAGVSVGLLIDVDTGLGRCGVRDGPEAVKLGRRIASLGGAELQGLMGYEGRLRASLSHRRDRVGAAFALLREAKAAIEDAGLEVRSVSAAGTSTLSEALEEPEVTEIQAGTYALMEADLDGLDLPFAQAAAVRATVISRRGDHVVLDAGRKTVGCDYGPPLPLLDGASTVAVSEEHTVIQCKPPAPELGAIVEVRPSHVRTTFNLHDHVWLLRDGAVADRATVAARGASQ